MRASELIGSPACDEDGQPAGIVRDLRLDTDRAPDGSFPILGLVLSDTGARAAAAHAWGFAEDRAQAPDWLKRVLGAAERSRFVSADLVLDWGPEQVKVRSSG
jgi:hypothetical protein